MACGGCGRRHVIKHNPDDLMGGYKYLTDRQIKARLEVYKKKYCKDCKNRYKCDYVMYVNCKKSEKK
jgi:hypothetical protein